MPLHFEDRDILSEVQGLHSVLIVPCRMCPAVTVAVRENQPFMKIWRSLFKSQPFERYLETVRARLKEVSIESRVFGGTLYHQWFMCMWTKGTRRKLLREAKRHDAVIVLGCNSATVTVRDTLESTGSRVIEGMEASGIMNAKLSFAFPCNISFTECKSAPMLRQTD